MTGTEWPGVLFNPDFQEKVKTARVLAVGAGGIGCELLKTLVLSGFHNIEVIDLDTIETSNLNRQFLFRRSHVGQSKAQVAAEVVKALAPAANIKAYQANVKEARFGLDYIKGFDIVLNGLDNMDARRHVNRLCVAAGVPLVESGTAGYVGQVSVHIKGTTECYECHPPASGQKTYPICTLRNTPDKPIHCVVWAKELLFPRLFGKVEVSDLDEQSAAPTPTVALEPAVNGNAAAAAANGDSHEPGSNGNTEPATAADKAAAAAAEAAQEAAEAASFFKLREGEQPLAYAVRVFERIYGHDIDKVLSMEELWKTRTPPSALQLSQLLPHLQAGSSAADADTTAAALAAAAASSNASAARALGLKDQGVWPVADAAQVFLATIVKYLTQRGDEMGNAVFDKDDDLAVDFVTAASNLRSACYGIPQQSAFDVKGMAGNIIHAIATTNAIVGGIIVSEALKVLAGCTQACRNSYIRTEASMVGTRRTGRMACLISGEAPSAPKAGCLVCGKAQLHLTVNTQTMTLQQLLDKVLRAKLAMIHPTLMTDGGFDYVEGEGLDKDEAEDSRRLLPRTLAQLPGGGLVHGTIVSVQDQSQSLDFELIICHQDAFDEEKQPEGFVLSGAAPQAAPDQPTAAAEPAAAAAAATAAGTKRSREDDTAAVTDKATAGAAAAAAGGGAGEQPATKRQKAGDAGAASAEVEVVELMNSDDGDAVVISD